MEKLDATSELQSRLSSLSVSSFPGITSKNCENNSEDRLRSTDLSQQPHSPASLPGADGAGDASIQPAAKSNHNPSLGSPTEGDAELVGNSGKEHPEDGKASLPPLKPPSTWTSPALKELKVKLRLEKDAVVTVYRGDVMTVHVPTVPEAKRICWEFATDGYDIGFGIYFDWSPVTSRAITVQISESSDDEDEDEDIEGPVSPGDVEKGSKSSANSNLGEILPVYRQDSHLAVQGGSHDFPGEGTYLLKFDNSYSLWRNKTLYYRVYYSA
ncbi:protein TMED8 [Scleropages formosus]|nr:protein TMED8 [Scleropages formosus]